MAGIPPSKPRATGVVKDALMIKLHWLMQSIITAFFAIITAFLMASATRRGTVLVFRHQRQASWLTRHEDGSLTAPYDEILIHAELRAAA